MHISRFPRLHFAHLPTPIEPLENLSKLLGGPQIYIKREIVQVLPQVETKHVNLNS
ncbi:MAG: hypothetical protein CM1200mP28_08270 [Deltaproteobacteria bacterium]|nr:MAG: hypothetical protein CM1200mP28_08270 [Deltaproteobacteria bacterium]